MDLGKIKKLMDMVEASGVSELEVRSGDETIRIVRPLARSAGETVSTAAVAATAVAEQQGSPVKAPMAGTFYAAPAPGAEPYVRAGQSVAPGDVLCIIESMKMMNEIVADRSGVCVAVEAGNGAPVNAGDTLLRIA
ncbi:MAG: acetyl-CoA carboxylase biotin carboxyl carrier protein [Pseudomonadales bacterium]